MNLEIWVPLTIINVSRYYVSSYGRIKNIKTGRILKGHTNPDGYIKIRVINDDGIRISTYIHRLVAMGFDGDHSDKNMSVDHIDRDRSNNKHRNLRWISFSDQSKNRKTSTRIGRPIYQLDMLNNIVHKWNNATEAAKKLGIYKQNISFSCINYDNNSTYKGYKWRFADIDPYDREIFKIAPFPELQLFECSNFGRIRYSNSRISTGYKRNGYYSIKIKSIDNKYMDKQVHRLIAATFLGKNIELEVNHIDGNKINNKINNLEYTSRSDNMIHAANNGLIKFYTRKVNQLSLTGVFIKEYNSITNASKETVINRSSIVDV